jgi:hypothetical protein
VRKATLARFACILLTVLGWGSAQALYDDGSGKTVHSYESMTFDFGKGEVTGVTGSGKKELFVARIVSNARVGDLQRMVFERMTADGKDRYTFDLAANALALQHEEVDTSGAALLRNRHDFTRPGT